MDAFAVQNMLRNCRGLPAQPKQQQQPASRRVPVEEDSSSSYSSSDDATDSSDLTNDHEYENQNHPSTVRKHLSRSNPVPSGGKVRKIPSDIFLTIFGVDVFPFFFWLIS